MTDFFFFPLWRMPGVGVSRAPFSPTTSRILPPRAGHALCAVSNLTEPPSLSHWGPLGKEQGCPQPPPLCRAHFPDRSAQTWCPDSLMRLPLWVWPLIDKYTRHTLDILHLCPFILLRAKGKAFWGPGRSQGNTPSPPEELLNICPGTRPRQWLDTQRTCT